MLSTSMLVLRMDNFVEEGFGFFSMETFAATATAAAAASALFGIFGELPGQGLYFVFHVGSNVGGPIGMGVVGVKDQVSLRRELFLLFEVV